MPFTVSHAAAAGLFRRQLLRGQVPLTPLVIGTMVPDFEYFIRLQPVALVSHSVVGLVIFCLPVGLAALWLWDAVIEDSVRELLAMTRRVARRARSLMDVLTASAWIVIGAATHVLWDSFTHSGRWGARLVPMLNEVLVETRGRDLTWAVVLDHVSTLVGGVIVVTWLATTLARDGAFDRLRRPSWRWRVGALIAVFALVGAVLNGAAARHQPDYWGIELTIGRSAIGAMLAASLALIAFALFQRTRQKFSEVS